MVSSEQRRKQLAREKYLRQQERRVASRRRARFRNAGIAGGLVLVLAAGAAYAATGGLNGDEDKTENAADAEATPSDTAAPSDVPDPCDKPAKGKPNGKQWEKEPEMAVDESATYTMTLETTCGEIGVEMDAGEAPQTVNSFKFLAGENYFDHTPCHRMTTQGIFVLQCGDPTGKGTGSPGYSLPDENLKDESLKGGEYPAGTVAMANSGPDTGGSQFFIVYKKSKLPPQYTPFGTVTDSSKKALQKIVEAGVQGGTGDGPPNATVVIDKATVKES